MAIYSGKPTLVHQSAGEISARFADLSTMERALENMPPEQRERMGQVEFRKDSLVMTNPQVGQIEFKVLENTPERIVLGCSSPLAMKMVMNLTPEDEEATTVQTDIDIDIPAMLKPFIGPHLQKAADQMGNMMAGLAGK